MAGREQLAEGHSAYLPVGSRFCDLQPVGYGSSGMVFSAVDSDCDKSVAIKRISLGDKKSCKSALREIRILRKLQHENIVKIYDVIFGNNVDLCEGEMSIPCELRTLCIVQELVDTDLRQVLEHQRLSGEHVRLFAYQLLRGLKYLHSANVLHRDLKPENVLINQEDLVLKIGDFGMARIVDPDYSHKGHLTQNVSTQWYRSPELVLQPANYTKAIDVWSVGCIVAEMVMGKPLFPGDHDLELMMLVLDSIQLNDRDLNEILCTLPSKLLKNYNGYPRHPLKEVLDNLDRHALELLLSMLTFDPSQRIIAEEALGSPYFKMYSCIRDEPVQKNPFHIESEVDDLPPITIKKLILEEFKERTESDTFLVLDNVEEFEEVNDNIERTKGLSVFNSDGDGKIEEDEGDTKEILTDNANVGRDDKVHDEKVMSEDDSCEKNETEGSEKSDDEEKEVKEEFKQTLGKICDNAEDGEMTEKGSVESDSEGSEKSETEDLVSEKSNNVDDDKKNELKGEQLLEKSKECNNPDNKDEKKSDQGAMSKTWDKESRVSAVEAVEKAFGDKLQKEKVNEQLSNQEFEDKSVRKKETDENKRLDLEETVDILKGQKMNNEKTIDDCLEVSVMSSCDQLDNSSNLEVVLSGLDEGKDVLYEDFNDESKFVLEMTKENELKYKDKANEELSTVCNTQIENEPVQQKMPDLREVLYVDIPRATASSTPKGSPRGQVKESSRSRSSLSPKERSVRPKKKDWFYTKH